MKRFKIFVGRDHYNRRPVYQVMDKVGDYVGEFHKSRKEAQAELKDLMRSIRKNPMKRKTRKKRIYTGRGIARNPMLGKYEKKALNFARKYPGWHGFDPRKPTANIVRKLAKKGLVKVSNISNQFRAI
jgi:hypothetical protein